MSVLVNCQPTNRLAAAGRSPNIIGPFDQTTGGGGKVPSQPGIVIAIDKDPVGFPFGQLCLAGNFFHCIRTPEVEKVGDLP